MACGVLTACSGGGSGSSSSGPPSLSIAPGSISVPAGETQQFTATSNVGSVGSVTWEVNGTAGGNSTIGTISSGGLYAAPAQVPTPEPITVTALSNGVTATASLTVTYSHASLQGTYMAGFTELAGVQGTNVIGYFNFDGQGDVSGTVDVNSSTAGVLSGVAVTGHYAVNPDGSGTLSMDAGAAGGFNFDVTLATSGIFAITDATGGKIVATFWVPQASVQGVTSVAPGTYILTYGGIPLGPQGVGAVTVTGNQLTVQELDEHNSGNGVSIHETALPGSYSAITNGRGTFSYTDAQGVHNFVMYAMPGGDFQIMSLDTGMLLDGSLGLQSATSLPISGVAVATAGGVDAASNPDILLAQTNLATLAYMGSENDNGLVTNVSGTGTAQSTDTYGRGQLTIPTNSGLRNFVYYVETANQIDLLETDTLGNLSGGMLIPAAQEVPIGQGNYVLAGGFYAANSLTPNTLMATLNISSITQITGTETLNTGGTLSTASVSGTLSFGNNGGMLTLNLSNGITQHFMVLGYNQFIFTLLGEDPSNISVAALIAQYFATPAS